MPNIRRLGQVRDTKFDTNVFNNSRVTVFTVFELLRGNQQGVKVHPPDPTQITLNLSQRLDLRSSKKHVGLQNLSAYYTWKNIRKQYKNNKLKIVAPTWNDEFELPDNSYPVSDIQDYFEHIIKKHETLTTIPPIYVYIS